MDIYFKRNENLNQNFFFLLIIILTEPGRLLKLKNCAIRGSLTYA